MRFKGGKTADTLLGTEGRDVIRGGAGNDFIYGLGGIDQLKGGKGRDTFVIATDDAYDIIRDFQVGKDRLLINDPDIGPGPGVAEPVEPYLQNGIVYYDNILIAVAPDISYGDIEIS